MLGIMGVLSSSVPGQGNGRQVIDLATRMADVTFIGSARSWELGASVVVGDLNGDGTLDLVLGAPGAAGPDGTRRDAGQILVFYSAHRLGNRSDTQTADLIVYGKAGDRLGDLSAVAVGDLNGDGIDDLVLGSRTGAIPDASRPPPGVVYVIYGGANLAARIDLATTPADLVIYGADGLDWFGQSVTVADIDNDRRADLIIGAPLGDGPDNTRINSGEVVIFFGERERRGVIDLARTAADLVIYGRDADDFLGTAVAAGDVNGDGRTDMAIASVGADGPGNGRGDATGEVAVLFGPIAFPSAIDLATEPPSWIVYGKDAGDRFGFRLTLNDISGDGIADLICSAPQGDGPRNGRTSAGEVVVLLGSRTAGGVFDLARRSPEFIIYGRDPGDQLGVQIGVADLTGDGMADLLLSAPGGDGPNNRRGDATGEMYVVSLSTSGRLLPPRSVDLATESPALTIYGSSNGEVFGSSFRVADSNLDGKADLVVGAPLASPDADRLRAGRVYLLLGFSSR
jgi:hypothetical protein